MRHYRNLGRMELAARLLPILALLPIAALPAMIRPALTQAQTPTAPTLQVVGLTMAYTDDAGQAYPSAFWLPAQVTIDTVDVRGAVQWYAYKDSAAFVAHKATIAQHSTQVDTPTFVAGSQQPPQGQTLAQVIAALAIGFGTTVKDTDTGTKDANGQRIMRPFFVSATPTTLAVTPPTP